MSEIFSLKKVFQLSWQVIYFSDVVIWVLIPCRFLVDCNVLEEHAAPIFRVEETGLLVI